MGRGHMAGRFCMAAASFRATLLPSPDCPRSLPRSRWRRWRASCGGRLRVIATVQDPAVVRTLLAHLARSGTPEPPGPAALA